MKAATDILTNPELGARLVKYFDPERDTDVRDAVRLLCDKRHIDWGKPTYDVIYGAIDWVRTRAEILRGEERPRDRKEA